VRVGGRVLDGDSDRVDERSIVVETERVAVKLIGAVKDSDTVRDVESEMLVVIVDE
jgi:hypothetical protein